MTNISAVCKLSSIERVFYLVTKNSTVSYEGYKNLKLSKNGELWRTNQLDQSFAENHQQLIINATKNDKSYPIGHVLGKIENVNG